MTMKSKRVYCIGSAILWIGLFGLFLDCSRVSPEEGETTSDSSRPTGDTIFEFGREDNSDREFRREGFRGMTEYRCRVGADCSTEAFPEYLCGVKFAGKIDNGVQRVTIVFRLEKTYNEAILRMARGGDETTVVKVDRRRPYLVTNTMLGSGEGYSVGTYNLKIGRLRKGEHRIELTVADDGKGNAMYQWDALSLVAVGP